MVFLHRMVFCIWAHATPGSVSCGMLWRTVLFLRGVPMRHHVFTVAILLAALGFYAAGMSGGGMVLLLLGGGLELWFWVRAMRSLKPSSSISPTGKV